MGSIAVSITAAPSLRSGVSNPTIASEFFPVTAHESLNIVSPVVAPMATVLLQESVAHGAVSIDGEITQYRLTQAATLICMLFQGTGRGNAKAVANEEELTSNISEVTCNSEA